MAPTDVSFPICLALRVSTSTLPDSFRLQATTGLVPWMQRLHHAVWKGVNFAPAENQMYVQGDITSDDRRDAAERMQEVISSYKEGAGESDDDEDNGDDEWD